jgi:hypothetical protein
MTKAPSARDETETKKGAPRVMCAIPHNNNNSFERDPSESERERKKKKKGAPAGAKPKQSF